MKELIALAAVLLAFGVASADAATRGKSTVTKITDVQIQYGGGFADVVVEGAIENQPECAVVKTRMRIDFDREHSGKFFGTALVALTSQQPVVIYGFGFCAKGVGVESLRSILISREAKEELPAE